MTSERITRYRQAHENAERAKEEWRLAERMAQAAWDALDEEEHDEASRALAAAARAEGSR